MVISDATMWGLSKCRNGGHLKHYETIVRLFKFTCIIRALSIIVVQSKMYLASKQNR